MKVMNSMKVKDQCLTYMKKSKIPDIGLFMNIHNNPFFKLSKVFKTGLAKTLKVGQFKLT